MYTSSEITHIHFEPTQKCQAECPMCDRTDNHHLNNSEIKIDEFKNILDIDFVKQLKSFIMCGNHGDPIIAVDTLKIYSYLRENNSDLYLHMTTNGGARNSAWWVELAKIMGKKGRVTFSVDGLEDTNHLYRINVDWDRVENSMESYTSAGGQGIWVFLIFEHNEHQVEEAERMAKLFGLRFVKKKTGRWVQTYKNQKVTEKQTKKGNLLKPPTNVKYQNESVNKYEKLVNEYGSFGDYLDKTDIVCKSLQNKEIYLSAEGLVFPCCWTAGRLYKSYHKIGQDQMWKFIDDIKNINAHHTPIRQIIDGNFFKKIEKSWYLSSCENGKLEVCAQKCGKGFDAFGDQWK
jgi:MoaA/NifB/PqqE/SkfB family radical SAM enzyme